MHLVVNPAAAGGRLLREGTRRRVDLIGAGDRVVLNAVGIGLLGAINVTSSNIKWVRGMSAYLVAGVATLANYRCPRIELSGDASTTPGR